MLRYILSQATVPFRKKLPRLNSDLSHSANFGLVTEWLSECVYNDNKPNRNPLTTRFASIDLQTRKMNDFILKKLILLECTRKYFQNSGIKKKIDIVC